VNDGFTVARLRWLEAVALEPELGGLARQLAIILAVKFANRRGFLEFGVLEAWPSQSTLSELTGTTRDGIRKALNSLVRAGLLVIRPAQGRRANNCYRLVLTQFQGVQSQKRKGRQASSVFPENKTANPQTAVCTTPLKQPYEMNPSPSLARGPRLAKPVRCWSGVEVGSLVRHRNHGSGTVVAVIPDKACPSVPYVDVEFERAGVVRLLSSVVTLLPKAG
jgi:hypothetical protein